MKRAKELILSGADSLIICTAKDLQGAFLSIYKIQQERESKKQVSDEDISKWICPQCGQKTFVCYVDSNGEVIDETCGRCNREDKNSYHLPLRDFYKNNGIVQKDWNKPAYKPKSKPSYMEPQVIKATMRQYKKNNLINFLCEHFPQDAVIELVGRYLVGTAQKWGGSTVFWHVDRYNKIRGGKIMKFKRATGKRVKSCLGESISCGLWWLRWHISKDVRAVVRS